MRKLTLFLCAVFLTMIGYSQGHETFENFDESSSSYQTGTFTGQDGSTWNYVKARGDAAAEIEEGNQALMLGRNQDPDAELISGTLENGIGTLSFTYMQAFSSDVELEVYVNDDLIYTATSDDQSGEAITTDDIDVNVQGDFTLRFFNPNGGQVNIDDVIWTAASDDGDDEDGGETCDDPMIVSSLPFTDSGSLSDYGNNYDNNDVPGTEDPNGVFNGTGSGFYLSGYEAVYSYTPSSDEIITISTSLDISGWHSIYVFTGCPFSTTMGYHTAISGTSRSIENLPLIADETYYILVSDWNLEEVEYTIQISRLQDCTDANAGDSMDDFTICPGVAFTLENENVSFGDSGLSYQWEESEDGDNWTDIEGATDMTYTIDDGIENSMFYRLTVSCEFDGSDTSDSIEVSIIDNPEECYCIPIYTTGCNSGDQISNVTLIGESESIDNDSECSVDGYGDYTDLTPADLEPGETYTLSVSTSYTAPTSEQVRAWIDYNQDGNFSDDEEIANSAGNGLPGGTGTFEFTVPEDADARDYRMRVRMGYGSAAPTFDACDFLTWGEAEDYTIEISGEDEDDFPSPYCDIDDDGVTIEEITAVGFDDTNIVNDNTDDVLIDKTDTVVDVMTGGTYTLEVEGNTSGDFTNNIVAFIDWNQNEVLDDEGEVYEVGVLENSTGEDGTSVSLEITVPDDAVLGTTRIRITKTYTDEEGEEPMPPSPAIINPCAIEFDAFEMGAEPGFGQALDFTLNIEEGDVSDDIDCDQGDISNNFENALQIGTGTDYENADDFIVSPGNTLHIQTIKLNVFAEQPIASLDLMFYDDDNGPGDIIITETGLTPDEEHQVLIGEAFGFNIYEIYVNVDLEFEGGDDGASYWMQPKGLAASGDGIGGVFWEVTTEGELGEPIHSREGEGNWLPDAEGAQAVFTLYCDEVEPPEPPVLPCGIDFTASVEPITRVIFADQIDNTSDATIDGSDPLEDFTDIEAIIGQGMTYDIALEGNTDGAWENFFTVFVDLTDPEIEGEWQEYEMFEIGSIIGSDGQDGQQATGQITLSEDIPDGTYTMRVVKNFGASPTDPCQAYSFGQAEDYTLIVDYELSVDDYQFENFTFYPNPVQNQLTLKAGEQIESVTVHNLLGQKVIDVNPNTLETQVDVDHLQAGVYLMNVTVNGTQKTFRIVKK